MSKTNLKPCPFCGEELIVLQGKKYYAHDLKKNEPVKCYAGTWVFRVDDEERIRLWNTRKPDMYKVIDQYKWERDVAISQLEKLGIGFGQKIEDEVIKAVKEVVGVKKNIQIG